MRDSEEKRVLVCKTDPGGIPRAWATGPESSLEDVKAEANEQLAAYRFEKAMKRDPLADAEYTTVIVALGAKPGEKPTAVSEVMAALWQVQAEEQTKEQKS